MGKTSKAFIAKDDYLDLIRRFPLRPIRSDADNAEAIAVLEELGVRADADGLSDGEKNYMDALNQLIGVYENKHHPLPRKSSPLEVLKFLMDQHGMNTTDLGELLGSGRGQASKILNGKRELSKANIRVLADRFKVSAALFL